MGGLRLIQIGLLTALIYLGISYPLIFHFSNSVFTDPNWSFDTLGTLYGIWWFQYAWEHGMYWGLNTLLAHPFGLDWSQLPIQPLLTYPLQLFTMIQNEIFAYNLYILINYVLTAVFTYVFCFYCTGHERGSLLGALIFTFAPNHLLQTMSHLGFSSTEWIPLFLLGWLYFWEKRTWLSAIFCSVSLCFLFWANYYFFFFCLFFCLLHLVFLIGSGRLKLTLRTGVRFLSLIGLSGALLSPQLIPLAKNVFHSHPTAEVKASGYERSEKDLYKYAARPSDYILPSEYHPVLGKITKWVQERYVRKRHFSDRTLYLGFFPLIMFILLLFFRRRFNERDRSLILLFTICALFFVWFSFSPWFKMGGVRFPSPSAFLYDFFPMFRYYSRAGFLVSLFVAVLFAYCYKYIPVKFSSEKVRNIVCAGAACLILFEFSVVPPFRNLDLSKIPSVYYWLKDQPGDFAVVEFPFVRSIEETQQKYMFAQRLHQKKLVNGGDAGTLSDMLRKKAQNIHDPELWSLLSFFNTKYVIVHGQNEKFQHIPFLKSVKQLDNIDVYEINAPFLPVYKLLWNFGQAIKREDGDFWRWIGKTARIWMMNTQEKMILTSLSGKIYSPEQNTLYIYLNGKEIDQLKIEKEETSSFKLNKIKLLPGENLIELKPERLVNHSEDRKRKVSFCLSIKN